MKLSKIAAVLLLSAGTLLGCNEKNEQAAVSTVLLPEYQNRLDIYKTVTLSADLSHLSDNQKKMLSLLIEASEIMDDLFWKQALGMDKELFLSSIEKMIDSL